MRSDMRAAYVLTVILLSLPVSAVSQDLAVVVLNDITSQPVNGALAYLISVDGSVVRSTLTRSTGRALFSNLAAGEYAVRVEMIGMSTAMTDLLRLHANAPVQTEVRLEPRPIPIEGLEVGVAERCQVRPAEGLLVSRVWDEARKALAVTAFTSDMDVYRYETMLYERDLDREARVVQRQVESRREADMRSPFFSRPAEELAEKGFVEPSARGDVYYAPDAHVLLSDVFLDSHCFGVRGPGRDVETEGLVGLDFEPVAIRGRLVDVRGTFWLDRATAHLQWLEYWYTNLPPDRAHDEAGGRIDFRRMPEGTWIVSEWRLRMPTVSLQRDSEYNLREFVSGFRESGGIVLDVDGDAGGLLGTSRTGDIEGAVVDSARSPLEGAAIQVMGSDRNAVTDQGGHFLLPGLPEGLYEVQAVDTMLEAFGHEAELVTVRVRRGATARLDFSMPAVATVVRRLCGESVLPEAPLGYRGPWPPGTGILLGDVRSSLPRESSDGVTIRVSWSTYTLRARQLLSVEVGEYRLGYTSAASDAGRFRFCWIPERQLIAVTAIVGGVEVAMDTLRIVHPSGVLQHSVFIPPRF